MSRDKRLTYKQGIDGYGDVGLRPGVTVGEAICKLADLEEQCAKNFFVAQCAGLTSVEILNLYRNWYYQEGMNTEQGVVAAAINEILPTHTRFLKAQQLAYEGKFNESIKRILK